MLHPIPPTNIPVAKEAWKDLAYDFIVKLPKCRGYDSILVIVNRYTKMAHFIPCKESTNAEELTEIFLKEIWHLHSLPRTTISDRGTMFNSKFLQALYKHIGVQPHFSSAFHPQTDGQSKRVNQWLEPTSALMSTTNRVIGQI